MGQYQHYISKRIKSKTNNKMPSSSSKPKPKSMLSHTLQDSILHDTFQTQLQQNLHNFIICDRLRKQMAQKGKQKVDEEFESVRKTGQANVRIHRSSVINKQHMLKAQLRHKMCQQIFTQVLKRVHQIIQTDQNQHCLFLISLIVQGALRMFQPELMVRCLPRHQHLVERVLPDCEETFNSIMEEETGRNYPLRIKINYVDTLDQRQIKNKGEFGKRDQDRKCSGGVILSDLTGDITYKNTIDTRVNILREVCLPLVRQNLWPTANKQI